MLASYLFTRVIRMPFNSIAELVKTSDYQIYVTLSTSRTDRIEPYLDTYTQQNNEKVDVALTNPKIAVYDNFYSFR